MHLVRTIVSRSSAFYLVMIDVLPQIINTIKETYNLQSYDPEIAINTKLL